MRISSVPGVANRGTGSVGADLTLESVLAAARGGRPVLLGANWRIRAARWPNDRSDECLCLEARRAGRWDLIAVLKPDGTWGY